MPRLFVFAIGGTGSRVLRSLTLLLASGMEPRDAKGNLYEIIPLMIDPDASNGNVAQTIRLLETYQAIRSSLPAAMPSETFFHASIKELSSLKVDDNVSISQGYKLTVPNIDGTTFGNFVNYDGLPSYQRNGNGGDGTKEFLELLFTQENLNTQLNIGFQGYPNMGAIVLNQFVSMPAFQFFASVFQPEDKIFIISSIFGGTGAAGFPLLVKNLRSPNPQITKFENINKATLGAIVVQPYFNPINDSKGSSPIDAKQFATKTKAALSYYEKNLTGINALYYIGDSSQSVYKNIPGGSGQRNKAHFVELASALAIFDFLHYPQGVKEFGLSVETDQIHFSHLSQRTYSLVYKPLARMWLLNQYLNNEISSDVAFKQQFYTTSPAITSVDFGSRFFTNIREVAKQFEEWIQEMRTNQVAFDPFNSETPYKLVLDGIRGYKSNKWTLWRNDKDQIVTKINRLSSKFSATSKEAKFIEGLSEALTSLL